MKNLFKRIYLWLFVSQEYKLCHDHCCIFCKFYPICSEDIRKENTK